MKSVLFETSDIPREVRAARLEVIDLSNPSKSTGTLRLSFKSCQEGMEIINDCLLIFCDLTKGFRHCWF